jgi:MFS family permease
MLLGLTLAAGSTLALFWAQTYPMIIALRVITGVGSAVYNVSRFAYIAEVVPIINRGRASALAGGVKRIGTFLGPVIGGSVALVYGLRAPFFLYSVGCVIALITVASLFKSEYVFPKKESLGVAIYVNRLISTLKSHKQILLTAGAGNFLFMMVRTAPAIIIPLYAADVIGLDVQTIGIILGLSAAIDMLFFYPAGVIMDRFGRKFAIIPSLVIFSIGLALIPFTWNFISLLLIGMLLGFGNGIGSGTMLTLGADLAPLKTRGEFLGLWLLIGNLGSTSGPLIIGVVASILLLSASSIVMSGFSVIAMAIFSRFVPETLIKKEKVL